MGAYEDQVMVRGPACSIRADSHVFMSERSALGYSHSKRKAVIGMPARKVQRKQPLQARARVTHDAILKAAARILVTAGYDRLTTNAVAESAGVSIGSLYQYFANKDDIVAALRIRHRQVINDVVGGALTEDMTAEPETAIRSAVEATIKAHMVDPELHRALAKLWPEVGRIGDEDAPSGLGPGSAMDHARAFFRNRGLAEDEALRLGLICCEVVEELTHAAIVDGRLALGPQALSEEITTLLIAYLGAKQVFRPVLQQR